MTSIKILMPFQAVVAFWISSPTFLGGIPMGAHLGARAAAAVISPPTTFM